MVVDTSVAKVEADTDVVETSAVSVDPILEVKKESGKLRLVRVRTLQ